MASKKPVSTQRTPLTNAELERLTADEFVRLRLTEDEKSRLREINKERERERIISGAKILAEQRFLLAELQAAGLNVQKISDLLLMKNYKEVVPILRKHLFMPYSDANKEMIARALAIPESRAVWADLLAEYRKAPMGKGIKVAGDTKEYRLGAKDGLACALAAAVTDATMEEFIGVAKDREHGESRILLLWALRKSKNPLAKQALEELAFDPDLVKEISSWKK